MKNDAPDPYAVLHIAPTATRSEVVRAYRALVRSRHPDTRPAEERDAGRDSTPTELHEIMAAYAILGNPERRAAYDRNHRQTVATPTTPRPEAFIRAPRRPLPAASLLIGPVRWESGPRWAAAMPLIPGPHLPGGYMLIPRIRP
ncbi:J domain-containing protein [Arthrobacter sp. M4]|uniref:J domain-containing protein n=1 Tax=Arthrobacter sp. M4 TaxID=218160 RepID=UPI001CDB9AB0|nr:J domain-containing protein [Arthrobacter sp. M4]MCA4131767.1 J domain-containing protein [Arthrobacter sp. M4]